MLREFVLAAESDDSYQHQEYYQQSPQDQSSGGRV